MSTEIYYKAVRPDGTDFYTGKVLWDRVGEIVEHPNPGSPGGGDAEGYLSVSVSPADCTGMEWPCRLLEVEPVYGVPVWEPTPSLPSKRASHAWRVVRELPAHEALGPNGAEVAAFLELLPTLTNAQWDAAGEVTRDAAGEVTWNAAKFAAWYAAYALVVRDLITAEKFDTLTAPMRAAGIDFDALTRSDRDLQQETLDQERDRPMKLTKRDIDDTFLLDFGSGTAPIFLSEEELGELRAHLQAERDAELGRWRDPENPSFVVYPYDRDHVRVLNERTANLNTVTYPLPSGWESTLEASRVAKRYFDAHRPRKPWHDAKEGEAWLITVGQRDKEIAAMVRRIAWKDGLWFSSASDTYGVDSPLITSATRIWPTEEADQ